MKIGDTVRIYGDHDDLRQVVSIGAKTVDVTYEGNEDGPETFNKADVRVHDMVTNKALGKEVQAHVRECTTALEAAFKSLEAARKAADKGGLSFYALNKLELVDFSKLERAMDESYDGNGWSSSSLFC